jgi:hypothetical protein
MKRIQIPKKMYDDIKEYCLYNNIKNVNQQITFLLELGFNFFRYGTSPFDNQIPFQIQEDVKEKHDKEISSNVEVQEKKEKKKGITIIKN